MHIVLVVVEHLRDFLGMEGHINVEVGGNVPRRVVFLFRVGTKFQFEVLDVVNAGKDNTMESVAQAFVTFKVFVSEHSYKIQEHLVIATLIHLVNQQHYRFGA